MKKLYALSLLFCTALLFADAQKNFIKQIPLDVGQSVAATADGGYILTGRLYATKYSADDKPLLTVRVGDSTLMELSKVIPTKDGGYIAIATTTRPFDEQPYRPEVCKLNKAGKIVWQKAFYGYQATDIAEDNAGNFVLAYYTFGDVTIAHLVKLDANGNAIWWRHCPEPYSDSYINAIKITKDNRYAVAGTVDGYANFSIFDSSGNQVVNKTFNNTAGAVQIVLEQFENGDFLFITNENNYGDNAYINRLTNTGDIVWQKALSQIYTYTNFTTAVITGNDILLAGYKENRSTFLTTTMIMAAMKDNGKLVSQKTVSTPLPPSSLSAARLSNGSFVVLASQNSYYSRVKHYRDSYILRFGTGDNICNSTAEPVNVFNNAMTVKSSDAYSTYTLNAFEPILTFTTSYNLTETKLCDGNDGLIAAAAEKAVAATTINNHNFTVATYPNPAVNKVAIKITLSKAGPVKLDLMDMFGKTVQQYDYTLPVGVTIKDINVSSLPGGTYLLKLTCGTELITTKISKQ